MAEINLVDGIIVGQYGESIELQVVDNLGNAVDISAYTTSKTITLLSPDSLKTIQYAVSFSTDGTNGKFIFTPASGDIDRPGTWQGQLKLAKASANALTKKFSMPVEEKLGT